MGDRPPSRRDFLTPWRRTVEPQPARAAQPPVTPPRLPVVPPSYLPEPASPSRHRPEPVGSFLRPPGARPEAQLLEVCQQCGLCVEACPHDAIQPVAEGPAAGTPRIDSRKSPCQLCAGLPCTKACASGALTPLDDLRAVRMGTAVIEMGQCLAYRGAPCRACVDVCPLPGVLVFARGTRVHVPVAGTESCVGCGVCHRYCPNPAAIRIVPLGDGAPGRVRLEPAVAASE